MNRQDVNDTLEYLRARAVWSRDCEIAVGAIEMLLCVVSELAKNNEVLERARRKVREKAA